MEGARHRDRAATRRIDAGNPYFRIKQQFLIASNTLGKHKLRPAQRFDGGFDREQVVSLAGLEIGIGRAHGEGDAVLHQRVLAMPERAQPLGDRVR